VYCFQGERSDIAVDETELRSSVDIPTSHALFQALEHLDIKADSELEQFIYNTIDGASDELRSISLEVKTFQDDRIDKCVDQSLTEPLSSLHLSSFTSLCVGIDTRYLR
jgi:hypothetical protein